MIPPNSGKRWTEEDDKELRLRIRRNEPQWKIARAMGRTFMAIATRAQQLGMKLPAPLRPRHGE
jgi:hypothetical protein